jgi:hypothetical protein
MNHEEIELVKWMCKGVASVVLIFGVLIFLYKMYQDR